MKVVSYFAVLSYIALNQWLSVKGGVTLYSSIRENLLITQTLSASFSLIYITNQDKCFRVRRQWRHYKEESSQRDAILGVRLFLENYQKKFPQFWWMVFDPKTLCKFR